MSSLEQLGSEKYVLPATYGEQADRLRIGKALGRRYGPESMPACSMPVPGNNKGRSPSPALAPCHDRFVSTAVRFQSP
ncbi:MAG TPA: hypothetical protein VGD29_15580 [Actinoplanes sp.]|jgi:hypothetical protein